MTDSLAPLDLLAVMAHPDDAELLCGGTLIKSASNGKRVGVLDLTAGEMGSQGSAQIRAREAEAASGQMGLTTRMCAQLPDSALENDYESRLVVVAHLRALQPRNDSKLSKIATVMAFMQQNLHHKLSIDHLARMTNMSRSAFHRAFRDVTGDSPLQYLKQLRLNKAKNLITYDQQPAGLAAQQVGYDSPHQFSREFKRYFGLPPSRARELPYSSLTLIH